MHPKLAAPLAVTLEVDPGHSLPPLYVCAEVAQHHQLRDVPRSVSVARRGRAR